VPATQPPRSSCTMLVPGPPLHVSLFPPGGNGGAGGGAVHPQRAEAALPAHPRLRADPKGADGARARATNARKAAEGHGGSPRPRRKTLHPFAAERTLLT
jgi:hypothetical protein